MLVRILGLCLLLASPVFAAPGDLDPTFGDQGNVDVPIVPGSIGISIVALPDDRLVVASSTYYSLVVSRYLEDGALDPSFGTAGVIVMPGGEDTEQITFAGLARQGDGKLVVGTTIPGVGSSTDLLVARLAANGAVDGSFGSGGTVIVDADIEEQMWALLLQADGKVVVAGTTNGSLLVRLDSAGMLDPGFGTDGIVRTGPPSSSSSIQGLAQQADGKLVAVGYAGFGAAQDVAVLRYETDGSLDSTFGTGGVVILPVSATEGDLAKSVAIQPDGKIVVTGDTGTFFNLGLRIFVARLEEDGSLDSDFATGGIFELESSIAFSVLVDAAGRVVMTGGRIVSPEPMTYRTKTLVLRLLADGGLDPTFGDGGVVLNQRYSALPQLPAAELMIDVVEDSRGRLVTAGWARSNELQDPVHTALSRFLVGDCGNGELESDEDCDDGNAQDGDCCSSACRLDAAGSACAGTGDLCALAQCDGAGVCLAPIAPDPTCQASLGATLGTLRIASPASPNRRKLRWSWIHGAAALGDFGNPVADTDLSFCMYDGTGELVSRLDVPGGATCADGPCWSASGQSFTYRDRSRALAGLGLLRLRGGGPGRASVTFIAKGAAVPVPALPLAAPIDVQLRASNGGCWGVTFEADSIQRNDDVSFRARGE